MAVFPIIFQITLNKTPPVHTVIRIHLSFTPNTDYLTFQSYQNELLMNAAFLSP